MSRLFSILVTMIWGIWIGGLVGVTLSVIALARTFPPGTDSNFGVAAPAVFALFEPVQLGLAAAALICTFVWRLRHGARGFKTALLALFALAAAGAVVEVAFVAPRINELREVRSSAKAEFDKFHKMSETIYGGTFLVLATAGILLPLAISNDGLRRHES